MISALSWKVPCLVPYSYCDGPEPGPRCRPIRPQNLYIDPSGKRAQSARREAVKAPLGRRLDSLDETAEQKVLAAIDAQATTRYTSCKDTCRGAHRLPHQHRHRP